MRWQKIIYEIIKLLVVLSLLVAMIYMIFFSEERNIRQIVKCGIILFVYVAAIIGNVVKNRFGLLKSYEKEYKSVLGDAFGSDKKGRKKLLLAIRCYNNDEYSKTHRLLDRLTEKCERRDDYCAVYMFSALCYTKEGLDDAAVSEYQKLLKYDASNSRAWSNMGLIYMENGRAKDAQECYRNAVYYDPEYAYGYNNLAAYYIKTGEPQAALENALKALEINSEVYQAMSAAAFAYKMLGDIKNAEKYCNMYGVNGGDANGLRSQLETVGALNAE